MDKSGSFNDFVTKNEASSPGFRHRLWLSKMKTALQIKGYNINHKKVYRLMKEAQLLQEKHQNLLRLG
jgi:hypothetical protein